MKDLSYLCGVEKLKDDMTQLVLNIEDTRILSSLKKILSAIDGVSIAKKSCVVKKKEIDITKSAAFQEAMEDKKHGRIYHAESVEDMFSQILGS